MMNKPVKQEPGTPPVRKRRKQQRSIDTRNKIIRTALSEFAKYGFDKVSTRGVALAAAVPHSLVLHYFPTKIELWRESAKAAIAGYVDGVPSPGEEPNTESAAAQLRQWFVEYIRFSAEFPDFFRMMTQENTLNSERLVWLVDYHVRDRVKRVTALIAQAQKEGAVIDGDPLQILYSFLGIATSPYRSASEIKLITGADTGEPGMVSKHIALCERLFFRD